MASDKGLMEFEGTIVNVMPNQMYKVELENGHEVTCYTGGKMRQHKIRLIMNDNVRVEMSPYDLTKGRITFRL